VDGTCHAAGVGDRGFFQTPRISDPLVQAVTLLQRFSPDGAVWSDPVLAFVSQFLGVSRKQKSFGVALGFGLFASVQLLLLALYADAISISD